MKLVFKKEDDSNISVKHLDGDKEVDFSYVEMVRHLIKSKKLQKPTVEGDFSDAEKSSIDSMVKLINEELEALDEDWEIEQ